MRLEQYGNSQGMYTMLYFIHYSLNLLYRVFEQNASQYNFIVYYLSEQTD